MSMSFTLKGQDSILTAKFFPPIKLDENVSYFIGLVDFETFNSIPNIQAGNDKFFYDSKFLTFPTGSYEVEQIDKFLKEQLGNDAIELTANTATLKCELKSKHVIDFTQKESIGPLLGFKSNVLQPNILHESDEPVQIFGINAILIDCSLVSGAYINGKEIHTIHQFAPVTPPGYRIIEVPQTVIYLPVNTKLIDSVTVKLLDQDGNLLNLRGETVTVRLHLRHGISV